MQSVHAGACFVRVGRCCLGSILGSILESFGEPFGKLGHHFHVFLRYLEDGEIVIELRLDSGGARTDSTLAAPPPPYMVRVSPSGANRGFPRPRGRTTGGGNQHNDYHTPGDPVGVGGFRPCVRWVREVGRFRALFTYPRVRLSVLGNGYVSALCYGFTQVTNALGPPNVSLPHTHTQATTPMWGQSVFK